MDPWRPAAEVVVARGERLVAVGERALLAAHPDAAVVDLCGRVLLPGFVDAHNHLSIAALHPRWADLSAARDLDDLARALRDQARREPEAGWIRAAGWDETLGGLWPDRRALDALGLERPVCVAHYSLHQAVVCSRGLDALGIGRTTPDPPGGMIERDGDGAPTGLLVERAWSAAHAASLAPYRDPARWGALIVAHARTLLRDGVTAVHDAACGPEAEAVYRDLARAGSLPLSVLVMPHAGALLRPPPASRLDGPGTGEGDAWLRVGPVKLFADGGIAPAIDVTVHGVRTWHGFAFDDLAGAMVAAVERGFRVAVHAMGNVGFARALEAFAAAARRRPDGEHRFRLEHATLGSPAQLATLARLGGVAVVQPGFVRHMGRLVEDVPLEAERWLPFASLARAGVPLAASSDHPCAPHAPLDTSVPGATRRTASGRVLGPAESLPYVDWLRAWTAGAAFAGGQEHERGTLAPGRRADLVVLDGDLDAERPPRVAATWVAGRRVWPDQEPGGR